MTYNLIQSIAMLIYIVILTLYGKRFGFSKKQSFILGITAVIVDYNLILLLTWIENGFILFGAQNAVRVFVVNPLAIYILAKIAKVDFRALCDYNAAPAMIWYGLGHLACLIPNCCHGYAYYEGTTMYEIAMFLTGTNMLPNQLLESVAALITGIILWLITVDKNYKCKGYLYYIMLIVYGTQRFLFEFLRDNNKIIPFHRMSTANGYFGISNLALWAFAMVVMGVTLLAITIYHDKKNTNKS